MADTPTQPTIFGTDPSHPTEHLTMSKLRIRGESYVDKVTPNGTISIPRIIIYGYGRRRWRLLVLDVDELPFQGSSEKDPPVPDSDRKSLYDEVMAQRERARIAERRVKELEERQVEMREWQKHATEVTCDWDTKCKGLEEKLEAAQGANRKHVEDCAKCPHIAEIAGLEAERTQDRRIISDQQGELVRLRPPPTPATPIRNKLPAQCFSCHSFTMFISQEGCGRDKGTTCPRGLDIPAKTAREYNQDMLAAREAAVMKAPPPAAVPKEVECKMCGAPFKPEGIHKTVCPSCYSNEVNAGEHFEEEPGPEGDDTADHLPFDGGE